jgi:TonB family protein
LLKTIWAVLAMGTILVLFDGTWLEAQEPPTNRYRIALLEVGALPVEALKGDLEHRILQINKGMQVDYHGWLSPMDVLQNSFFSTERRQELHLPSSKQEIINRCLSLRPLLDPNKYIAERDPLHLILMHFLLKIMDREEFPPSDLTTLLEIFQAGIGLEAETADLLHGRINWRQAGDLYRGTHNRFALWLMPKPSAQETEYLAYLKETWADKTLDAYDRWYFLDLLVRAQPQEWLEPFFTFTRSQLAAIRKNGDICGRLLEIGTATALELVAELLTTESSPQSQAVYLYNLITHQVYSERLLVAVLDLADKLEKVKPKPEENGLSNSCEVLKTIRVYLGTLDLQINHSPNLQRATNVCARLEKFLTPEYAVVMLPPGEIETESILVESHARIKNIPYEVIVNRLPLRKPIEPRFEWPEAEPKGLSFDFALVVNSDGQVLQVDEGMGNFFQQNEALDPFCQALADTLRKLQFVPLILDGRATIAHLYLRLRVRSDQKRIEIDSKFNSGNVNPVGWKRFPCDSAKAIRVVIPEYPLAYSLRRTTEVKVHCVTDIYGRVREAKIDPSSPKRLNEFCLKTARRWIFEPYIVSGIPKILSFTVRFIFQAKNKGNH